MASAFLLPSTINSFIKLRQKDERSKHTHTRTITPTPPKLAYLLRWSGKHRDGQVSTGHHHRRDYGNSAAGKPPTNAQHLHRIGDGADFNGRKLIFMKKTINPVKEIVTLPIDTWKAIGADKFGQNPKLWQFKCPICGGVQTLQDFIDNGVDEPDGKFYFSCIGRWVQGRGCDWTLGGLFRIHKTEVIPEDGGKPIPVLEFA